MSNSYITGIGVGAITGASLLAAPAMAAVSIPDNLAQTKPIHINVISGKTTAINFHNERIISYLILSDRSTLVYSLNAPPESGQARSIFLRQIKPLDFPGETTSNTPNLFVVVLNEDGNQEQYEFIIDNTQRYETEINIVPEERKAKPKLANVINTELGAATPEDIRIGLKYNLRKGHLSPEDPLVLDINEAIAITLNENKTLLTLAKELDIPLSVLSEIGKTGLAQKAKYRIQQAKESNANLATARRSLINSHTDFVIDTDLGDASFVDIQFGFSIMRQRDYISPLQAEKIVSIIRLAQNDSGKLSFEEKAILRRIGRLGLAFNARRKIFGTLDL
jgi:hypothetical protein